MQFTILLEMRKAVASVSPRHDLDGNQLCALTVHAHPDDEASKGAPTFALYGEN
jgi:hypothetical protein